MRFLNYFLFFILIISTAYSKENSTQIGIVSNKIFITKKEAMIAAKAWTKYMASKGYENVTIKFYKDENILIDDYVNNRIETLTATYQMYFNNKQLLNRVSKKRWIPTVSEDIFEQYYLIKNKDSNLTLNTLNKASLYYMNSIGKTWVDFVIMKEYRKSIKKVFSKIIKTKKPQKSIFNVFFNKNSVSVVSKKLFNDMLELNPQIKNKIEILKKSKAIFLSGVGFTNKKINPYYENMHDSVKEDMGKNGKIILSPAVKIYDFYKINDEELKPLDRFFENFFNLKKLYN